VTRPAPTALWLRLCSPPLQGPPAGRQGGAFHRDPHSPHPSSPSAFAFTLSFRARLRARAGGRGICTSLDSQAELQIPRASSALGMTTKAINSRRLGRSRLWFLGRRSPPASRRAGPDRPFPACRGAACCALFALSPLRCHSEPVCPPGQTAEESALRSAPGPTAEALLFCASLCLRASVANF